MGRKQLSGVILPDNWTSVAGALEGVLRALGDAASTAWIMGITGLAFRTALPVGDPYSTSGAARMRTGSTSSLSGLFAVAQREGMGPAAAGDLSLPPPRQVVPDRDAGAGVTIAASGGQAALDPDGLATRIRALGWKAEAVYARRTDRDYTRRRAEALKRVHKSIDQGVPAVVHDLHLPRFGLVTGYDDKAGLWSVRSMMSGQTGDRLPVDRWPVPERDEPVFVLALTGRAKADPRRAVHEALRYAVSYFEGGEPGDRSGALHGRAALSRWVDAFATGEPVDPYGNAMLVQTLQSARRDAVAFLKGEAARVLPDLGPELERAAAAYTAEVFAISRMMTMFPFPSGGDPANPASRIVATGALHEALAREEEAVGALRLAIGG